MGYGMTSQVLEELELNMFRKGLGACGDLGFLWSHVLWFIRFKV